jgi:osmotically-inducible protein OsmY
VNDPRPSDDHVPMQYVVARLRDALAHDERVAALDIQVRIVGSDVFLTGMVSSDPRRAAVEDVVRGEVPDLTIHNQLDVLPVEAPTGREEIS